MSDFVLDQTENPHPVMLTKALHRRRIARACPQSVVLAAMWLSYLDAMCDATGETSGAINAWLDRHDTGPLPDAVPSQPVHIKGS